MSLKVLTQLSHFITMLFGVALGMTLAILYQYINQSVDLTIMNLYYPIIVITLIGIILRIITIFIWKNKNYNINSIHSSRPTK
ncbi:uncharacterized protein METZ01_LOCUS132304 [marine metagenome]|uniref:Uncharacterized protein n=1 Tax=marine metagenome TaxID=408172 RepID=A0A381YR60_9ZZZZ